VIFFARFLTYIGVGLAVLFFVIAGIQYIIGRGEEGKNNLITTFIGLIVIILAYTAVNIIVQLLQSGSLGNIFNGSGTADF
jgi:amino acid permease